MRKKRSKTEIKGRAAHEMKDFKGGFSENTHNRKQALSFSDISTDARKLAGWKWMQKGKTSKQVAPANIEKNILENWKLI